MNTSQKEYIFRINRVVDYIDNNLNSELNLECLAEVANFSPYHFHRIFSALTSETLNSYIQRKRLERAARRLIIYADEPIAEIAFRSGFKSHSVFCRNFKRHFGISAQKYRETTQNIYSKIRQVKSNNGQYGQSSIVYVCEDDLPQNWRTIMKNNIEIKEMPELNLIYVRHIGAFDQIENAFGKLMQWAGSRGLLQFPKTKTVTVYHDDPKVTHIDKMRQSACITVEGAVKTEGEIGSLQIPGGKYIVGRFEISPFEFKDAWSTICLKLSETGYQPNDGCPYELYHNDHTQHPEQKFILDICIPVKPL